MSYVGYTDSTSLFVKFLVEEFKDDYEGLSYIEYFNNIKLYLEGEITDENLIEKFNSSDFCIFELDFLCKDINEIVKENITYKQKLHQLIDNNINSNSTDNMNFTMKGISILFDDFSEIYNENIFDYECFYISLYGMFLNFSQEKFMEYISHIIRNNSLTVDDFYFLLNFIDKLIDFKYSNKYLKQFILYSKEYLDDLELSGSIVISIFNTFRLKKTLHNLTKRVTSFWKDDKYFILMVLKLFTIYCDQYNDFFIEENKEDSEIFILNKDIVYSILKLLTKFPINQDDNFIIISAYSKLIYDYSEYKSIKSVTELVKYLISPNVKYESIQENVLSSRKDEAINVITSAYLCGIDYVSLFIDRCKKYGFNREIALYVLKLILGEEVDNKKRYFIYFIKICYKNILDDFDYGDESTYRVLMWITNDILNIDDNLKDLHLVLELLSKFKKFQNEQMFNIIKSISNKLVIKYETNSFESHSFYKFIINEFKGQVYTGSLESEYFYAKNFLIYRDFKILDEKKELMKKLRKYFEQPTRINRNDYYEYLISNKYFEVYKFDIIKEIKFINIDYNIVKKECDFLIYNSPHDFGLKLGLLISSTFEENLYDDVYKNLIYKTSYGDIFQRISERYSNFNMEEVCSKHKSFLFLLKRTQFKDKSIKHKILTIKNKSEFCRKYALDIVSNYKGDLDVYSIIYIIIFSNHLDGNSKYNNLNMSTVKLKTIIYLLQDDRSGEISKDAFLYNIFMICIKLYGNSFDSLTQFEVLNKIYEFIENKYFRNLNRVSHKEIEVMLDEEVEKVNNEKNFINSFSEVLRIINKILRSSQADDYYEAIFVSENIDLIMSIIENETKFYNEIITLIDRYIKIRDYKDLEKIYRITIKKSHVARSFIKLISNYQTVLLETLNNKNTLEFYSKIVENAI